LKGFAWHSIGQRAATLAVASAGLGLFIWLGLPLPFLFGPMVACLVAALCGARLRGFGQLSTGIRSVLGIAAGAAVTPALITQAPQMLWSLLLVPVYVIVIAAVGIPFFRRFCGFDRVTAFYSAMPGGTSDMMLFGQEAGGNLRQLSLVHVTRLMVILLVAPVVLLQVYGVSLNGAVGEPLNALPWSELALMLLLALVGWKGGERIGLFGATIMGPLILAAICSMLGLLQHRPPREALLAAQFLIGTGVGVSYVGITLRELRNSVAGGAVFVVILACLTALMTEIVMLAGLSPPLEAFLAFTPGGQAEMAMLAIVSGADLGFVVLHHLTRVLLVILGAPILFRLIGKKGAN
jgi:membrane AbrB-like protein